MLHLSSLIKNLFAIVCNKQTITEYLRFMTIGILLLLRPSVHSYNSKLENLTAELHHISCAHYCGYGLFLL